MARDKDFNSQPKFGKCMRLTNSEFWAEDVDSTGSVSEVHYKAK